MESIRQTLLTDWSFVRIIRLVLSIIIIVQAVETREPLFGLLGAFFLFQALSNTGCCGTNACATSPISKGNQSVVEDVEFEEIKK